MKKKVKQTFNIIFNIIIFLFLLGSAFAISFLFGVFFLFAFAVTIYNKDIKKKPWKILLIFVGALIARLALGGLLSTISNPEVTLDFVVAVLMLVFIFLLGWKVKRK